jgi:hypothetical protein
VISVSATGVVADGACPSDVADLDDSRCDLSWQSAARVAADYDGTLNTIGDRDEEWNLQIAFPLKHVAVNAAPGARVRIAVKRCEIAYDGRRACGGWGSVREPAELIFE